MCSSTFSGRSPLVCLTPYTGRNAGKGDVYVKKFNTTCETNEKTITTNPYHLPNDTTVLYPLPDRGYIFGVEPGDTGC
ncbi:hypothetical protein GCM10023091_39760 [Ravibacter arvi]|uniref:Uncharacterized protein n=1 Tax=Ravibacter arvi TaxID=2051041 RepID=A0ABP8MB59_9BACT